MPSTGDNCLVHRAISTRHFTDFGGAGERVLYAIVMFLDSFPDQRKILCESVQPLNVNYNSLVSFTILLTT